MLQRVEDTDVTLYRDGQHHRHGDDELEAGQGVGYEADVHEPPLV